MNPDELLHSIPNVGGYLINKAGWVWSEKKSRWLTNKWKGTKKIAGYIHRILAELFIINPDNLPEVNHIDGNKLNNTITNLEWCSHRDNMTHAFKTGLCKNRAFNVSPHTIQRVKAKKGWTHVA